MAEQRDLDFTYTTIDRIFRLSIGETGDYSGAKYDGDFSMTVEEAQQAKHKFIADSLNIKEGSKVLDMACGWGPFSKYIRGTGERLPLCKAGRFWDISCHYLHRRIGTFLFH